MSTERRSSGQLKLEPRFLPGQGWVCEVWTYRGEHRYTSPACERKADAIAAAVAWRKRQKEDRADAARQGD